MSDSAWEQFKTGYRDLEIRPLAPANVDAWLRDWSELEKSLGEHFVGLSRSKNEDTRNRAAEDTYLSFVREVLPPLQSAEQTLKKRLLGLEGYEPDVESVEFSKRFRNEAELFREENVTLLTEELTLGSEYEKFMGGLTVELDDETVTIPEAERKLLDPDRKLRERMWRAIHNAELSVAGELDILFLKLLKLRRQIAENAGFTNYRDYRWRELNRFNYAPGDSRRFHASIASEVVPLLARLREEQRQELNLAALRPWDVQVDPRSRPALRPFDTVSELEDGLERITGRLVRPRAA